MPATDDLTAELIKFNAFLAVEDDRERQVRAERKAVKDREAAAADLKRVMADAGASKDDKDAAEEAWKAAVATEERVKAGEPAEVEPAEDAPEAAAVEPAEDAPEAAAVEPAAEDAPAEGGDATTEVVDAEPEDQVVSASAAEPEVVDVAPAAAEATDAAPESDAAEDVPAETAVDAV